MACGTSTILKELKDLVDQVGGECGKKSKDSKCCDPCLPTVTFPFAQVTMLCPPPIPVPTRPEPVQPLRVPCPYPEACNELTIEQGMALRYDNFYNNYNIDWHNESPRFRNRGRENRCTGQRARGFTVDGQSPCCNVCRPCDDEMPGCPTGFLPCTMKLSAPPCCDPNGVWMAEIQPCPPKPKKSPLRPKLDGDCCKK